jgi:hypothetical protein
LLGSFYKETPPTTASLYGVSANKLSSSENIDSAVASSENRHEERPTAKDKVQELRVRNMSLTLTRDNINTHHATCNCNRQY